MKRFLRTLVGSVVGLMCLAFAPIKAQPSTASFIAPRTLKANADETLVAELNSTDFAKMQVGATTYTNSYGQWLITPNVSATGTDSFTVPGEHTVYITINTASEKLYRAEYSVNFKSGGYVGTTDFNRIVIGDPLGERDENADLFVDDLEKSKTITASEDLSQLKPNILQSQITLWFHRVAEIEGASYTFSYIRVYGKAMTSQTVGLDNQGGTGGSTQITVKPNGAMPTITLPTRTGYTFGGYYSKAEGKGTQFYTATGAGKQNWSANISSTLYAYWIPYSYTVKYNGNKPAKAPASSTVNYIPADCTWEYETTQYLGGAPELAGYKFDGWYTDQACTNKLGDAFARMEKQTLCSVNNGTVNLYAKWKVNDAVQGVANKIDDIKKQPYGYMSYYINNAQSAYNSLSAEDKAVAEAEGYLDMINDAIAAKSVIDMIQDLGDVEDTPEWRQKLQDVRSAYEELNDKSYVPAESVLRILEEDEAALLVIDTIKAIGDPRYTSDSKDLIDAAQNAYDTYIDNGYNADKILNVQTLIDANRDYDNVLAFTGKVKSVYPLEYTPECKARIDAARDYYENTLDDDQKNIVHLDAQRYLDLLINFENAYQAMTIIDGINDMENTPEFKEKLQAARDAVEALDDEDELPLMDENLLKELSDKENAYAVMEKINAIYPMVYGDECEASIIDARNEFENLTEDQKTFVINIDDLLKAESDYAAVEEVITEVSELGDITHDEESLKKIQDVRKHYESLSDDQKNLYPEAFLEDIEDYETAYAALDVIYQIGEIGYDEESEGRINDARAFYESLSEDQKKLIQADDLEVLTNNETQFESMRTTGNIVVTLLLILSSLDLIAGGFFLFLLLKMDNEDEDEKKKKKQNQQNKPAKMMSVTVLPVIFTLASHYVDAPYIALYVIAGLAILVWLAVLVLFVLKKLGVKTPSIAKLFAKKDTAEADTTKKEPVKQEDVKEEATKEEVAKKEVTKQEAEKETPKETAKETTKKPTKKSTKKSTKKPAKKSAAKTTKKSTKKAVQETVVVEPEVLPEEEEVEIVNDKNGDIVRIRRIKSFMARFAQSDDTIKEAYSELKNYALSYENTRSRTSWSYDSINVRRKQVVKFAIRGKSLCIFLALNPDEYAESKYKVERIGSKKYLEVPCLYRITNERRRKYAKDLIDKQMKKLKLKKVMELNDDYKVPFEETPVLLKKGLIKEYKTVIKKQSEPA